VEPLDFIVAWLLSLFQRRKILRGAKDGVKFTVILEGETMSQENINVNLQVNPAIAALTLKDANGKVLADGDTITLSPETVGTTDPGQVLFNVSGGQPPYSFALSSGAIPAGDVLSSTQNADGSETVTIAGTPSTAGANAFAVTVSDSTPVAQSKTLKIA
jgi:hypothetical protein